MNRVIIALSATIIGLFATGCRSRGTNAAEPLAPKLQESQTSLRLVTFVTKILQENGQSGSLVYEGNCSFGKPSDPFKLTEPPRGSPPLQALGDAFAQDTQLSVTLESGLIRVTDRNVPHDLLDLQISQIVFGDEDDPRGATQKLLAAPEINDYLRAHHIEFLTVQEGMYAPPTEGAPRVNGTMKNATISQVLDRIVRTFPGVWVYRECAGSESERMVYIGFQQFSR